MRYIDGIYIYFFARCGQSYGEEAFSISYYVWWRKVSLGRKMPELLSLLKKHDRARSARVINFKKAHRGGIIPFNAPFYC